MLMNNVPSVTVDQMREIDRLMIEDIGVSVIMMMENASRNIAALVRTLLGGSVKGKKIVILCGKGNNAGDGLGASRHLINFGASVTCFLTTKVSELRSNAKTQYSILQKIQADVREYNGSSLSLEDFTNVDLIIDALIGYSLNGNPNDTFASFIDTANKSKKPILAVDIPSGLNGDSGFPNDPAIKATTTITLALPKVGLLAETAKKYVGELYLTDLSVPKAVYEKIGIKTPIIFENAEIIKIF